MRIAQIAPLVESVPPRLYGGTERIVSYITEDLVTQGHDVTLFASGDSITSAKLVPCYAHGLRLNPSVRDPIPYYMLKLTGAEATRAQERFIPQIANDAGKAPHYAHRGDPSPPQ